MTTRYVCLEHPEEAGPGGFWACIEVAGAQTDGSSRHDRVWVTSASDAPPGVRAANVVAAHDRATADRDLPGLDIDDFKRLRAAGKTQEEAFTEARRNGWREEPEIRERP